MAKTSYKVATSLNGSWGDQEIDLVSSAGWGSRPTPLKQLAFWGIGIAVVAWAATSTPLAEANLGLIVLFVIWGLLMVFYLGKLQKTGELRVTQVPIVANYVISGNRRVMTRRTSDPTGLFGVIGITDIEEDGRLHFADGGQGQMYSVVGVASTLLFDEDRIDVIDRVDAFYVKIDSASQWIFMTTKEPQRVQTQLANLELQNQALEYRDPELVELMNEQYDILDKGVGGQFSSIHQYLLIKSPSEDALERAHVVLRSESETSSLMFKEVTMLDREQAQSALRVLFTGTEPTKKGP